MKKILLILYTMPISLSAQENPTIQDSIPKNEYIAFGGTIKVFLIFLVMLLLFMCFAYLMKKFQRFKPGTHLKFDEIKIVHTLYIDQKKKIIFLKIFDQIYILGSAENGINLISTITSPELIQKFHTSFHSDINHVKTFQSILKKKK